MPSLCSLLLSVHPLQYDAFLSSSHGIGRSHASLADYEHRAALLRANLRMIEAHNAANRSFTMAMNRWEEG